MLWPRRLDVQVRRKPRILLDEDPTRLDLVAHERGEDLVRNRGVLVSIDTRDPKVMAAEIRQDIVAYARTLTLAQLEGASALQHLREDLNERVVTRTNGQVSELIIETMVVQ